MPLYFAAERPTVVRDGTIIVVDDDRMHPAGRDAGDAPVRFRSLGCWPLSGAIESTATSLEEVVAEMLPRAVASAAGG